MHYLFCNFRCQRFDKMCYEKIWISGWRYDFTFYTNEVIKLACLRLRSAWHLPVWSVFYVHSIARLGPAVFSSACWRSLSDSANAQADLDLHWAHMYIIGFVKNDWLLLLSPAHLIAWLFKTKWPENSTITDQIGDKFWNRLNVLILFLSAV